MNWLTEETISLLLDGVWITVILTAVTTITSFVLGITIGFLRLSARPSLRLCATIFVDLFRNIPTLVLIIFLAFAVPNLFTTEWRRILFFDNHLITWFASLTGLSLPYYAFAAIVGLTLNTAAYLAELFRAGVGTIPRQIIDAARSLGATPQVLRRQILLPQGIRAAFPAMMTRLIHNLKNTALASFVAVPDFFQATQASITRTFRALEFLLLAAVVYLILIAIYTAVLQQIERRLI